MSEPQAEAPRRFQRQRTLKGARIVCDGARTFDVTIRDMSEGGVKLKLGAPFAVPLHFELIILNPNTGISEKRRCETRWQRGDQVGAQFVAPETERPIARPEVANLRRPAAPG